MKLGEAFTSAARAHRDRVAIETGAVSLSYGALNERVSKLCNSLSGLGIRRGDVVAGILPNRSELIELDLACTRGAFVRTLLNSKAAADEFAYCLEFAGAKALLFDHSLLPIIERVRAAVDIEHLICVGGSAGWAINYEALLEKSSGSASAVPVQSSSPHSIYFTSGTTGKPKGVLLSHGNWIRIAYSHLSEFDPGIKAGDAALLAAPVTHAAGSLVVPHLLRGSRLILRDHFDAEEIAELLGASGVTATFMAPTMIQLLMRHVRREQAAKFRLKSLLYGGAPFPVNRLEEALSMFGPVLVQGYGQWESPLAISALSPDDHVSGLATDSRILASAGRAALFSEVAILDDDWNELEPGKTGEIATSGPHLMMGYLHNTSATNEIRSARWQRTGDVGEMDDRGYVYITDRKKDMIISGGVNVYPRQVEEVLYENAAFAELCVVGLPDELWGETVHVVAVRRANASVTEGDFLAWARERLPRDRRPRSAEFVESLPKSSYGKIVRRQVRDEAVARKTSAGRAEIVRA